MFIPKKIIIESSIQNSKRVTQMLERIKSLNPVVDIEYMKGRKPDAQGTSAKERYFNMKDTLVLTGRVSPFIETFASPGYIVEEMVTVIKSLFNCSSQCEYCYLQKTALRQPYQRIYCNLDRIEQETSSELILNRLLLTLLSAYSFYTKAAVLKIPKGFKDLADKLRVSKFLCRRNPIDSNEKALEFLRENLKDLLEKLGLTTNEAELSAVESQLSDLYRENGQYPLWFNISEYSDILAIEHIAGHLEYFMGLLKKNKDFRISFFTKSANVDCLLPYEADNRVKVIMNFNTSYVIEQFEHSTSSLGERLDAARRLQNAGGFIVIPHIEPILAYPGYKKEYLELAERIMTELDVEKIDTINIGAVRYASNLISTVKVNYPNTLLFSNCGVLQKPAFGFDRYRYNEDERFDIYSALIEKFKQFSAVSIRLGAETPEIWDRLGLSSTEFTGNNFYQYGSQLEYSNAS